MGGNEWDSIDTQVRGKGLMLAGAPDREGVEPTMYGPQDWNQCPMTFRTGLRKNKASDELRHNRCQHQV